MKHNLEDRIRQLGRFRKSVQDQMPLPALANKAVIRCTVAMDNAAVEMLATFKIPRDDNGDYDKSYEELDEERLTYIYKYIYRAYRQALPPLMGIENIRDFVVCVAHGVTLEAIDRDEANRLLYAAQVAAAIEGQARKRRAT
jgi:hypothetical protein